MGTLVAKFTWEQTRMLYYKNVLVAHRFVGNFDVLKEAARAYNGNAVIAEAQENKLK